MAKEDNGQGLPTGEKKRGRPRNIDNSDVVRKLRASTDELLKNCSHFDLTERQISSSSGVNEAMIHYYFGNKDGLIVDALNRVTDEVGTALEKLGDIDPQSSDVTAQIVKILMDAYYKKPWLGKILMSEFGRSGSKIVDLFLKKQGPRGRGMVHLRRVFDRLVASGVYDGNVNAEFAVLSMFAVVMAPQMLAYGCSNDFERDVLTRDRWVNYVADLFDSQLRPTNGTRPISCSDRTLRTGDDARA